MTGWGRRVRARAVVVSAILFALGGCGSDPSGSGFLNGSVVADGEAPGSALLLVNGRGVMGVEGTGGTLSWSDTTGDDEIRALLVDPGPGGALTFRIRVEDVGAPFPQIAVLQLAGREDQRLSATDIQVRIRR